MTEFEHENTDEVLAGMEMSVEEIGKAVVNFLKTNRDRFTELKDEQFDELVAGLEELNENDVDPDTDAIGLVFGMFEQNGLDDLTAEDIMIKLGLLQKR